MRRPLRTGSLAAMDAAAARQVASLLLDYPSETLLAQLPLLRDVVAGLPDTARLPLARFLDHVAGEQLETLQARYVETFDLRRRCSLYLSYYAYGDTRKRGMALLRFKHAYRAAGVEIGDTELPDHLAVVLEFAATTDAVQGERLLNEHRPGVELIRLALEEQASPYADVLAAVSATLPDVDARDREAVLRLAQSGPPQEDVGLDPFTIPSLSPTDDLGARR